MEAMPLANMYIQYDIDIRSVSPFATRNSAIQCMFTFDHGGHALCGDEV